MADLAKLSLNQITVNRLSLAEAVEACVRHHVRSIGVWRDKIEQAGGATKASRILKASGLQVSSLCRGGFFPAKTKKERDERIADNLKAIEEAAEIGTDVLVLVCGGLNGCTIGDARKMIEDGISAIVSHATISNVKLGIEPLHPMFAADRSVVCSLREANDLAEKFDDTVGVIVDVFHVWHEADIYLQIARASKSILGFHVSDWQVPLPDILLGRALMGDGVIEINKLRTAVEASGFDGLIEVEIFNREVWDTDADEILGVIQSRFRSSV